MYIIRRQSDIQEYIITSKLIIENLNLVDKIPEILTYNFPIKLINYNNQVYIDILYLIFYN